MLQKVGVIFFGIFALALANEPDTEFLNINSRVPGDQLIWQSTHGQQNFDFYAKNTFIINYPQVGYHSPYEITHIHIDAKENTGLMDLQFNGGPGTDYVKLYLTANSVKSGDYKIYIYGKKK